MYFKLSNLIGATHIPVVPRFYVLSFPRPFLTVVGLSAVKLSHDANVGAAAVGKKACPRTKQR